MNWMNIVSVLFYLGAFFIVAYVLYGGWQYFTRTTEAESDMQGGNQPKSLG